MSTWLEQLAAGGRSQPALVALQGGEAALAPGEWPARRYVAVLLGVGAAAIAVLALGYALDLIEVAAIGAAIPFAFLILIRPELGLFLMVVYIPFEHYGVLIPRMATMSRVIGLYAAAALGLHLLGRRRLQLGIPGMWLVMAFVGWGLLTLPASTEPTLSWTAILTLIQMAGLVFVVANLCTTRETGRALLWVMFIAAVFGAAAAFIVAPQQATEGGLVRTALAGEAGGTNQHAKDVLAGVILVPVLWTWTKGVWRLVVIAGLLIVLADIASTGSRSMAIATLAGLLVAVAVYKRLSLPKRAIILSVAGAGALLFLVVGVTTGMFGGALVRRMAMLQSEGLGAGQRSDMWQHAISLGLSNPFKGVGIGAFRIELLEVMGRASVTHNDFLMVLAETGFIGLGLYLAVLFAAARSAWRIRHTPLGACLVGLFVAAVLGSLANPSLYLKSFWLQMAVCMLAEKLNWARTAEVPKAAPAAAPARPAPMAVPA